MRRLLGSSRAVLNSTPEIYAHPEASLEDFAGQPLRWLLACLRGAEWRRLAARRADFRDLPEPDTAGTALAVKAVAGRDRAAALPEFSRVRPKCCS